MRTKTSLVAASFLLIAFSLNFRNTKQEAVSSVVNAFDQQLSSVQTEQAGDRTPKSGDGRREFVFLTSKAEPSEDSANSCEHRGSGRLCPEQDCPDELSQALPAKAEKNHDDPNNPPSDPRGSGRGEDFLSFKVFCGGDQPS